MAQSQYILEKLEIDEFSCKPVLILNLFSTLKVGHFLQLINCTKFSRLFLFQLIVRTAAAVTSREIYVTTVQCVLFHIRNTESNY